MRNILFFIVLFFTICISIDAQDKFNAEQLKLRAGIESFLREEGFVPEIDTDGDITFKKEGEQYFVLIDNRDVFPFYLSISKFYKYDDKYTRQKISEKLDALNLKKAVKVILYDGYFILQSEMFLVDAESFKFVFYKLLSQLEALIEEVENLSLSVEDDLTAEVEGSGTFLINEDFSSYSNLWKTSKGKVSYKGGRMIFKDTGSSGYSDIIYTFPKNLYNEDFQLSFSMKVSFDERYSSMFFILGTRWDNSYRLGFCDWGDGKIVISYGTKSDSTKYYDYSKASNLDLSVAHQYTMIKRGQNVEWYADGKILFSTVIDAAIDMNLLGFLVPSRHVIEVDYLTMKLI